MRQRACIVDCNVQAAELALRRADNRFVRFRQHRIACHGNRPSALCTNQGGGFFQFVGTAGAQNNIGTVFRQQ